MVLASRLFSCSECNVERVICGKPCCLQPHGKYKIAIGNCNQFHCFKPLQALWNLCLLHWEWKTGYCFATTVLLLSVVQWKRTYRCCPKKPSTTFQLWEWIEWELQYARCCFVGAIGTTSIICRLHKWWYRNNEHNIEGPWLVKFYFLCLLLPKYFFIGVSTNSKILKSIISS